MWVAEALRTPRGRGNDRGALKDIKPAHLLGQVLKSLQERCGLDTALVNDAIFGCVTQTAEQGANVGKLGLVAAGWSDAVSGLTINRYCASGLSAVAFAALQAQQYDGLAVGGGVEMMSRVPMASDKGPLTHDGDFQLATGLIPIGIAADAIATQHGFTRHDCDAYAVSSQERALRAIAAGELRSVVAVDGSHGIALAQDETPRPGTTAQKLASMPAAFAEWGLREGANGYDALLERDYNIDRIDHVHHAGNSPAMADGAAAVLVGTSAALQRQGLERRARILAVADVGVDRTLALTGSVDAARLAIRRAGLAVADIDLFEVNESFAALMLHFEKEMGIAHDRLNVNGGAIALGHPMGATGAMLLGTLIDALMLRDARYGCVAICGAVGVASAMVIERVG